MQQRSRHVCIRKSDEPRPHPSDASLQNLSELTPVHISAKPNPSQEYQHDKEGAFLLPDSKSSERQVHNPLHSWIKQTLTAQLHLTKELLFFSESSNGPVVSWQPEPVHQFSLNTVQAPSFASVSAPSPTASSQSRPFPCAVHYHSSVIFSTGPLLTNFYSSGRMYKRRRRMRRKREKLIHALQSFVY